jgi:hypothetical protein
MFPVDDSECLTPSSHGIIWCDPNFPKKRLARYVRRPGNEQILLESLNLIIVYQRRDEGLTGYFRFLARCLQLILLSEVMAMSTVAFSWVPERCDMRPHDAGYKAIQQKLLVYHHSTWQLFGGEGISISKVLTSENWGRRLFYI